MAKRRYRMTPKRRAALKKAQAASARKRRKAAFISGARTVGVVAGGIATAAAIHHVNNYALHPDVAVKHGKFAYGYAKRKFGYGPKVDPNAPGVALRKSQPLRYYGTGTRARHVSQRHAGMRIRSKV